MAQMESFTAAGILALARTGSMAPGLCPHFHAPSTYIPHGHRAAAGVLWASACSRLTCRSGGAPCNCRCPPTVATYPWRRIGLPAAAGRGHRPGLPRRSIDALVIEESVNRARGAGSRALLVMHRGELRWSAISRPTMQRTLLPAALVARPLAAMAMGIAIERRPHRFARYTGGALPARVGRRAARPDHRAPAARGDQRPRNRWRHRGLLYRSPWDDLAQLPAVRHLAAACACC